MATYSLFIKSNEAELIQYLNPVGFGPSLNTCPRCASHSLHLTSILVMPWEWSDFSITLCLSLGTKKLGHPQPASNLASDSNRGVLQHMQVYEPLALKSQYLPVKGRSVPACLVT